MTDIYVKNGVAFRMQDGKLGLVRCFDCGKENYAPAVSSGVCAWCGFDCNNVETKEG